MRYYLSYWVRMPGQDWEKRDQVIEAPDLSGAQAQAKQKMAEAHGMDSMTALHPIDVLPRKE